MPDQVHFLDILHRNGQLSECGVKARIGREKKYGGSAAMVDRIGRPPEPFTARNHNAGRGRINRSPMNVRDIFPIRATAKMMWGKTVGRVRQFHTLVGSCKGIRVYHNQAILNKSNKTRSSGRNTTCWPV